MSRVWPVLGQRPAARSEAGDLFAGEREGERREEKRRGEISTV